MFTYIIDIGMACAGILMFGDDASEEITNNIFRTPGYPAGLSVFIAICIAIIPLSKIPLNARPIVSTLEVLFGLDTRSMAVSSSLNGMSGLNRGLFKISLRIITLVVFVFIAIVFPSFDRIMALMGSLLCFTICIILPLAFYLKIFGNEISLSERIFDWFLVIVSSVMAIVGTAWAFLPFPESSAPVVS